MDRLKQKRNRKERRIRSVKYAIRPKVPMKRLYLFRSNRYLHSQVIDDSVAKVLCSASTSEKDFPLSTKNIEAAKKLGELMGKRAKDVGISKVVFDRRGLLYHGKVAAFVDAVRESGLEI